MVRNDPVSVALYAAIIFRTVIMVVVGVGQLFFEIAIAVLPILIARHFLIRRAMRPMMASRASAAASLPQR